MNIDSILQGFDDADPSDVGSGGGQKISVSGQHLVEVLHVRLKESEQYSAVYLIVEFKILGTNAEDRGIRVGDQYSWSHDITNKWYGLANMKQFLAAACGENPESEAARKLGKADLLEAIGDAQPLAGQQVRLVTTPKTTKGGFDFTRHDWAPAE